MISRAFILIIVYSAGRQMFREVINKVYASQNHIPQHRQNLGSKTILPTTYVDYVFSLRRFILAMLTPKQRSGAMRTSAFTMLPQLVD